MSNSQTFTDLSFFDRLRIGVTDIENKVKLLKQLQEKGFENSLQSISDEDVSNAKLFDRDVRNTYVEVSTLYNTVKGCPINLNCVQNEIQRIKQMLTDIESNSSLKEFGYKPWVPPVNLNSTFRVKNETENIISNTQNLDSLSLTQSNDTEKQESVFRQKIGDQQQHTIDAITAIINDKQINTDKPNQINNKLVMCRTPQLYDFGISNRRTLLPEDFLNLNKYNDFSQEIEIPCYDSSVTSKFNCFTSSMNIEIPTSSINYNINGANNITPPNMSITTSNATDSFVTVEFTPGLTTKRPKNISRVKPRYEDYFQDKNTVKLMPQFLQNDDQEENITPEQPINNLELENNVNTVIKTLNKSGTPSKPQTRVNENLHNKLIRKN